jgi:hypothetical protein
VATVTGMDGGMIPRARAGHQPRGMQAPRPARGTPYVFRLITIVVPSPGTLSRM